MVFQESIRPFQLRSPTISYHPILTHNQRISCIFEAFGDFARHILSQEIVQNPHNVVRLKIHFLVFSEISSFEISIFRKAEDLAIEHQKLISNLRWNIN
jgi:hypothetical protein